MKNRTYIKNLKEHIGEEVTVDGWVDVRRDHGKLIFIDLRDMSGIVQMVALPNHEEAHSVADSIRSEWVVEVNGIVNKRPEKMIKGGVLNGDLEIEITGIKVLSSAEEMPFDKDEDMNIDTYLDNLPLTLRSEKHKAVFKVQACIVDAFREFLRSEGFTEVQIPKIVGGDAEGGAGVFEVDYFDKKAYLATSPQLYKQIMVGIFERVFVTSSVYRAEKHSTTRHLNEYTTIDFEMGFIKDHMDIMNMQEKLIKHIIDFLKKTSEKEFEILGAKIPEIPEAPNSIPVLKLREAQEIIKKEYDVDCTGEPDLEPQHERWLSEYAKKKYDSEFIYITHYPVSKRPFYTYEDEEDKGFTKSFDLLFRGVEITTGGQRIHDYKTLVENIKKWKMDPEKFSFYLQAFKYGMPPEGGIGMGLERFTAKLLNLDNIKEAALFPRDLNRIDTLLSK
jgi:nondiscriminating aspartyl-tRNA synthetase